MERLDIVLVNRGLVETRQQAKRLILAGAVKVNNNSQLKPGQRISIEADIVVEKPPKYVSRGGLKLEKALIDFDISIHNRIALDVGASTGGFTDCLLQHGADFVYAVDVGYGQLAWKLRKDPRVQVIDKTNIRYIDNHIFAHPIDIAVIDVSFISLQKVLPIILDKLGVPEVVALIKPQFEAGRGFVKKGGIVDDPDIHKDILNNLSGFIQSNLSTIPKRLTFSPIYRDIGNIEYLLWLRKNTNFDVETISSIDSATISDVVNSAHSAFNENKSKHK